MRTAFMAASAAALLLAAGCGGDDDAGSAANQPAGVDTTAATPATTAAAMAETTAAEMADTPGASDASGTIPEVAASAGTFSTLLAAVEAAGLSETLSGEGPFTVFAPTDAAFAALPEGTLDALLADPAALSRVLTYHVVGGEVRAADVVGLTEAGSLEGDTIAIALDGDTVVLNDSARVVQADIPASNGVIHVIDSVLLPPEA